MKNDTEYINSIAVRLISELIESRYEMINEDNERTERGYLLMTFGEIAGIIEMADALKEVLEYE